MASVYVSKISPSVSKSVAARFGSVVGRCEYIDEDRGTVSTALALAVQDKAVKVAAEVGGEANALAERDRASRPHQGHRRGGTAERGPRKLPTATTR